MTNALPLLTQIPFTVNWTLIISVCAVCLTAMTAAISIFRAKKSINDDELRESNLINTLSENVKNDGKKNEDLKEAISILRTEIEKIKVEMANTSKSVEDLRKDNRELVQRLDELLRQLLDLLSN